MAYRRSTSRCERPRALEIPAASAGRAALLRPCPCREMRVFPAFTRQLPRIGGPPGAAAAPQSLWHASPYPIPPLQAFAGLPSGQRRRLAAFRRDLSSRRLQRAWREFCSKQRSTYSLVRAFANTGTSGERPRPPPSTCSSPQPAHCAAPRRGHASSPIPTLDWQQGQRERLCPTPQPHPRAPRQACIWRPSWRPRPTLPRQPRPAPPHPQLWR
jgi:hypothetical protein